MHYLFTLATLAILGYYRDPIQKAESMLGHWFVGVKLRVPNS